MIRISSFYPTESFARKTLEFSDDSIAVKVKSLIFDAETTIEYEKIKIIQNKTWLDLSWVFPAVVVTALFGGLIRLVLFYFGVIDPTISLIEKAVVIVGLLMLIPVFRKYQLWFFLDSEKNSLVNIKIYGKDQKAMQEAIEFIKQKTTITSEIYIDQPIPATPPIFEITDFDFPDFLNKVIVRFYDDKILIREKSLVEEQPTEISYHEFNGKTQIIRMGNNKWDYVWSYWLFFIGITLPTLTTFFSQQVYAIIPFFSSLMISAFILIIPLYLLKYIKNEYLVFHDKEDDIILGIKITSANRAKLDEITKFIQEKISLQNTGEQP